MPVLRIKPGIMTLASRFGRPLVPGPADSTVISNSSSTARSIFLSSSAYSYHSTRNPQSYKDHGKKAIIAVGTLMTKEGLVSYWMESSEQDSKAMMHLFKKRDYP